MKRAYLIRCTPRACGSIAQRNRIIPGSEAINVSESLISTIHSKKASSQTARTTHHKPLELISPVTVPTTRIVTSDPPSPLHPLPYHLQMLLRLLGLLFGTPGVVKFNHISHIIHYCNFSNSNSLFLSGLGIKHYLPC